MISPATSGEIFTSTSGLIFPVAETVWVISRITTGCTRIAIRFSLLSNKNPTATAAKRNTDITSRRRHFGRFCLIAAKGGAATCLCIKSTCSAAPNSQQGTHTMTLSRTQTGTDYNPHVHWKYADQAPFKVLRKWAKGSGV